MVNQNQRCCKNVCDKIIVKTWIQVWRISISPWIRLGPIKRIMGFPLKDPAYGKELKQKSETREREFNKKKLCYKIIQVLYS